MKMKSFSLKMENRGGIVTGIEDKISGSPESFISPSGHIVINAPNNKDSYQNKEIQFFDTSGRIVRSISNPIKENSQYRLYEIPEELMNANQFFIANFVADGKRGMLKISKLSSNNIYATPDISKWVSSADNEVPVNGINQRTAATNLITIIARET